LKFHFILRFHRNRRFVMIRIFEILILRIFFKLTDFNIIWKAIKSFNFISLFSISIRIMGFHFISTVRKSSLRHLIVIILRDIYLNLAIIIIIKDSFFWSTYSNFFLNWAIFYILIPRFLWSLRIFFKWIWCFLSWSFEFFPSA
jgi:hypothetical protein